MDAMTNTNDARGGAVLVTGASRGIGEAVARALAASGRHVLLAARGAADLERVRAAIATDGGRADVLELDVADPDAVARVAARALELTDGALAALVNNAGIARAAPLVPKRDREGRGRNGPDYEAHLAINFHGPRRLVEALAPTWIERGAGTIVNVASSAALYGYPYVAAYCASKHALLGWSRSAALETSGRGLRWFAVCPHYVDSPMLAASVERVVAATDRTPQQAREHFAASNPSGRLVTVEQVAEVVRDALDGTLTPGVFELDGAATRSIERWERDAKV